TIILRTGAKIIHVDSNASDDSGDGFTWETAKKTVQGALDAAFFDDQVWVKTGTYNESITMPNGVALYGGFTGTEDQRSPKVNVTTIDGGSAYRTIFVSDTSAIIDGFTIAGDCIGVYCSLGDCTISNNNIIADDAGIYSDICNVSILNNTVTATDGNGIYCYSGNSVVVNNLVMDCGSVGVWTTSYGCASDIVNNTLIANSVGLRIDVFGNSNITVTNNIIAFNSSYGINYNYYGGNTPPTLSHNCVSGNGSGGTDNYYNISAGTGDRSDDPLFIDRENIDHNLRNYHLRADSPCIDTGTSQDAPSTDLDGNSRPINGNFDIGAYEFSDFTHPSVLVTSATSQTNVGPIVFTVTFSEPVTGFNDTANDVIVDGTAGVLSANISPTSDPAVYTVSVSGMTTDGYVTLSIPADAAADEVGNGNTASPNPVATVNYDYTFDTISAAATCADGTLVRLYGKRVTAVFPDCLYVQDVTADSNFGVRGIRVYYSGQLGVGVGQSVDVSGTMGTTGSERCITGASVNIANSIRQPLCVYAMINRTVGGGNWKYDATTGKGQRGITGAYGWNNIGLLVKSWGKVTAVDTSSFTISDGSTSFDGTSSISVKVITAPENIPALNSYVAVMGISSCEESGSDLISVIRVRSSSDIQTLQAETVTLQLLQSDYNFIGIPALPADPSPGAIFNVPNMSLVRLEPITQTEISWPNDSTVFGNILLGEGYRVSSPSACSIQYSGYKINLLKTVGYRTAAAISLPGYPEAHAGPIGYHRVANPFDYNINLSSGSELFLTDGESMKAWSTAASSGWCDIMMYGCNPSTGINYTVSYLSMAQEYSLNARSGYDFYTNINNLALIIPEVDTTGPSVSVSAADGQANPSNTSPIRFTVEFSEPVFDFDDNGDVTIGGTAGASSASITDSGDHKTYTVAVSGMTSNGTVTLIVNAGAATDANSNNNTASTDPIATVAYNGIGDALPIITILSPIGTTDDIAPVVTWSASGQFTQYQVYIENIADANDFWDSGDVVGSSSAVQVTKLLNNGSTYSLKARVYGAGGWGPWSDTVQFTVNFVEPPLPTSVLYCQQ
ncbi:MAG: choice-of-anchor Q domain-containing protein, partial [Armatimonadota bacterium]